MNGEGYTQLRAGVTQLNQDVALIQQDLVVNNKMTEKILTAIEGNGGLGLKTQAELNKTAINRIWYWITSISGAIIIMAGFAIRGMLLK